ncbi:nitrate transporter [Anopheles sinensis]|uniref:Nitrate transporter n=1 Tax=Anopheles sinensis TaxID=74873 RepID=A0A084WCT8_ANOSI|nr:nitrate transporter [Anopheles sinensis]
MAARDRAHEGKMAFNRQPSMEERLQACTSPMHAMHPVAMLSRKETIWYRFSSRGRREDGAQAGNKSTQITAEHSRTHKHQVKELLRASITLVLAPPPSDYRSCRSGKVLSLPCEGRPWCAVDTHLKVDHIGSQPDRIGNGQIAAAAWKWLERQ